MIKQNHGRNQITAYEKENADINIFTTENCKSSTNGNGDLTADARTPSISCQCSCTINSSPIRQQYFDDDSLSLEHRTKI
jgi:hypothetical protein